MTPTDAQDGPKLLRQQVDTVSRIRLTGAPRTLILDAGALLDAEHGVPPSLAAKLAVFTRCEGMRVVVLAKDDTTSGALRGIPHVRVVSTVRDIPLDDPGLAITTDHTPLPPHMYAWYVGPGSADPPAHAARHTGPRAADQILALFGTAEVQERAGLAFRAAGAGREIPHEAPFDPRILDGIAAAVGDHPRKVDKLLERQSHPDAFDLDRDTDRFIAATLRPILRAQAENGAVAAAPPPHGPNEPNYWFFWQRDAGQVILGMIDLSRSACADHVRHQAKTFIGRYLDFVERLPRQQSMKRSMLGVSRFDMAGKPIEGYGNPQNDGPAHTVLAVIAALGERQRAYLLGKPYLEYLWNNIFHPSFDPWEFAVGDIFFDYNLARRALRAGSRIARAAGDHTAAHRYWSRANEIEAFLETFRQPNDGFVAAGQKYLQPFLDTISHLDIGVVGSVLTGYEIDDTFLNVDDPLIAGTMSGLEQAFAEWWPVNIAWQKAGHAGMGMGRFPEDANDGIGSTGGNPWTFATLWAAQYYLRLAQRRASQGMVAPGGRENADLMDRADGYLRFVLSHVPPEELTEQIDGQTGTPRGASKLAWAQAALISTLVLRQRVKSESHRPRIGLARADHDDT